MFHHVKELQFNARVSRPDPRFARLLLEQFGGGNGELKAAMQYFVQAFGCRHAYPDKYDLLMDIAAEEFSHLEIVGATITMLLAGVNGEMKNAVERSSLSKVMEGKQGREELVHEALTNPQFLVLSGGGPTVTDSVGHPWSGNYVNANGDLTVDLRSDIAAESRAKIVYEYLLQFTDDPLVQESLRFLMTREIAHFQMFSAALQSIRPNFPPGVLQGDPRFTHTYFNMSNGEDVRGPWNEGEGPWKDGGQWAYINDPISQVRATEGLVRQPIEGAPVTDEETRALDRELSAVRSAEVKTAMPSGETSWSTYDNGGAGQSGSIARKPRKNK
ncbi:MAG: manganese catalase family protein [Bryobacteraceae bacterium]|nr:manganese catalase family protein [Bryobacteraceae bacterium]